MKKIISLFIPLILCTMIVHAKDTSVKVFKDYFNDKAETYDFNIRNPFYATKLYVTDIDGLKNKIIKETYESYTMDESGLKSYSDSYIRNINYTYYIFDSNGRISDEFYVSVNDDGYVFYKKHTKYSCNNKYEILVEDLIRNTSKVYQADISYDNNNLILTFTEKYKSKDKVIFNKEYISEIEEGKKYNYTYNYYFNHDVIKFHESKVSDEEEILSKLIYKKCCIVERTKKYSGGNLIYRHEEKELNKGFISLEEEGGVSELTQEYIRQFNPLGFLEYEYVKPYGKIVGDYSELSREILSKRDDFFYSYFN